MGMFNLQAAIYLNEAREETLTNELTDNSMDLRLKQKRSDNDIQAIRDKYAPEKERIENEIADLDKTEEREEYQDLIAELRELKDEEEQEVEKVENETNDFETKIQMEISKNDPKLADKPEAALAKIVEGKVNKALSDLIALEQEYVLDPSKKIKDALGSNKILKFVRYQVGEGLEKRVDNFAEEVMNQAK
jgi:oligoendopeptidase F